MRTAKRSHCLLRRRRPECGGAPRAPAASHAGEASGPPLITINGGNHATILTGATYSDLGATIPRSQADLSTRCGECYRLQS